MSRSYRKPYSAITGTGSAAHDKMVARRCWRHAQNQALSCAFKNGEDWDEFLIPNIYEASYNDVWGWGRDGNQTLQEEPVWEDHLSWFHCNYFTDEDAMQYATDSFEKAKKRHAKLCRK